MFERKASVQPWVLAAAVVLVISHSAMAQVAAGGSPSTPSPPASAGKPVAPASAKSSPVAQPAKAVATTGGPSWAELTAAQKTALAPLAESWPAMVEAQKRKWLEISKNHPRLSPAEQATMHSRMNEWVAMTPQQRAQARLNFAKTKEVSAELTPDEKKAKWETYQALTPEEKKGLAATAAAKPAGAATAVKPVAPQKLVALPQSTVPAASSPGTPNPAAAAAVPAPAATAASVATKP